VTVIKVGYARVSSTDQNLDRQLAALKESGVEKLFAEKISGKNADRPELQRMLHFIRERDEVVVLSLDRLGRSSEDLTTIIDEIRRKGAVLNILDLPSFAGIQDPNLKALLTNLVLEIYKYTAEEERRKIRERQREGIKLAKKRGVYKGRQREYSADSHNPRKRYLYQQVIKMLRADPPVTVAEIARTVGLERTQIYRIKKYAIANGLLENVPNRQ
jgi:DNA invertase Pin-like site-specific DNA recombinase